MSKMKEFIITLLILMMTHLRVPISASEVSQNTNLGANDENNLNNRMSLIEAKNQQQEKEIYFLKAVAVEDKKDIRHLKRRVSRLESLLVAKSSASSEKLLVRLKRPYRLLPVSKIDEKQKDKIDKDKVTDTTFYGPATNCLEIGKLGFTLNGYYLVKGNDESNRIEAVFCRFKLPGESKTSTSEERLGLVSTSARLEKSRAVKEERFSLSTTIVSTKPTSSTSSTTSIIILQTTSRPNASFQEERPILVLGSKERKKFKYLSMDHGTNKSYPLVNSESGKCLEADESKEPNYIIQIDCNPSTVRRWKLLNGKQLCDESSKCITTIVNKGKLDATLVLAPMVGTDSPHSQMQNVTLGNSKIRVHYGNRTFCVSGFIGPTCRCLFKELRMNQACIDNYKIQNWAFVSFE